jgi:hypothetical protein
MPIIEISAASRRFSTPSFVALAALEEKQGFESNFHLHEYAPVIPSVPPPGRSRLALDESRALK